MAVTVTIPHAQLLPLANALGTLQQWTRPGMLAFRFGQILAAVRPHAQALFDEQQRLAEEYAVYEGEGEARKRRTRDVGGGLQELVLTDAEAYRQRERELLSAAVDVQIVRLLTESDIQKLEKELVKQQDNLPPIDFSALAPVFEGTAQLASTAAAA